MRQIHNPYTEAVIATVGERLRAAERVNGEDRPGDAERLASLFAACYRSTLEKALKPLPDGTAYLITGDIPAMWLRDSAAQMRPCLLQAKEDGRLRGLITGLVKRQFAFLDIDIYANAFNETPSGACWARDETEENPWVWERKFEVDSLCYPLQLAYLLWKTTGAAGQFDGVFHRVSYKILDTLVTEQCHEEKSSYRFVRRNTYFQDTLSRDGKGALVKSGVGLVWSGFRPSDDACVYGYLIPSNMFAVTALGYLKEIAEEILEDGGLARRAQLLREEIWEAVERWGVTEKEGFGPIYAYETDGFGQYNLMDDANVPSLLSMSYLGYEGRDGQVAANTRRFILSQANPYYYIGKEARGIGSLHTPAGYVWHIALAMEGLTEPDRRRKLELLRIMADTDGGRGLMHEGFCADDSAKYTREWFSWANAMFCELALDYTGLRPGSTPAAGR